MTENAVELKKLNDDDYYLKPVKFVRDLVLGYVYLTKFEIKIIDTLEFQRLKDIRQLTCQQVFPSARHTRFEHSLGVMELTKQALDSLNENGFIFNGSDDNDTLSDKSNEKEKYSINTCDSMLHLLLYCTMSVTVRFHIWGKRKWMWMPFG